MQLRQLQLERPWGWPWARQPAAVARPRPARSPAASLAGPSAPTKPHAANSVCSAGTILHMPSACIRAAIRCLASPPQPRQEIIRRHLRATLRRPHRANDLLELCVHPSPLGGRWPQPRGAQATRGAWWEEGEVVRDRKSYNILPRVSGPAVTAAATIIQHAAI